MFNYKRVQRRINIRTTNFLWSNAHPPTIKKKCKKPQKRFLSHHQKKIYNKPQHKYEGLSEIHMCGYMCFVGTSVKVSVFFFTYEKCERTKFISNGWMYEYTYVCLKKNVLILRIDDDFLTV